MKRVELEAPAKVNLWLRVLGREESGFHSLESLFCALDLADTVLVERGGEGVRLEVEGEFDTGPVEQNLAFHAARRFLEEAGAKGEGVSVALHKRIPSAAGLGGGSSDAAATLRALDRLYDEPLGDDRLLQLGIELGSDVPFFLSGSPLALGWSRGERLLALPPLPQASVLIAHPGEPMPTGAAFQGVSASRVGGYRPQAQRIRLPEMTNWEAIAVRAANDFEPVVRKVVPRVGKGLDLLRDSAAMFAQVAGSGASIFGIFPPGNYLDHAEEGLRDLGFRVWRATTLSTLPDLASPAPRTG